MEHRRLLLQQRVPTIVTDPKISGKLVEQLQLLFASENTDMPKRAAKPKPELLQETTMPATPPMKFVIKVEKLLSELNLISGVEDRRKSIPVLQNLSIVSENPTTLKITATDLDVTLTCQAEAAVSQPGSILVPMARLLDITRTFPKTAEITFQALEQGGAKITCERAKFTLVAPEFDSFPELPKLNEGEIEIPSDDPRQHDHFYNFRDH